MINPIQMRQGVRAVQSAIDPKKLAQVAHDMATELGVDLRTMQDRLFKAKMSGLNLSNPETLKKAILGDFKSVLLPSKHTKKDLRPIKDTFSHFSKMERLSDTVAGDRFDAGDVLRRGGSGDFEINNPVEMKLFQDKVDIFKKTGRSYFGDLREVL